MLMRCLELILGLYYRFSGMASPNLRVPRGIGLILGWYYRFLGVLIPNFWVSSIDYLLLTYL